MYTESFPRSFSGSPLDDWPDWDWQRLKLWEQGRSSKPLRNPNQLSEDSLCNLKSAAECFNSKTNDRTLPLRQVLTCSKARCWQSVLILMLHFRSSRWEVVNLDSAGQVAVGKPWGRNSLEKKVTRWTMISLKIRLQIFKYSQNKHGEWYLRLTWDQGSGKSSTSVTVI